MASFEYRSLYKWPGDPAQAKKISAFLEHANVRATLCKIDEYGDVTYDSEVPLRMRSSVPLRVGPGLAIYGMIAEPVNLSQSKQLLGKDLILASWPTSRGWFDRGVFKMGYKDGKDKVTDVIERAYRESPRALRDCLLKLTRNPYDTRKNVATAMLVDPYSSDPKGEFILGRDCYYGANPPKKLISVCENFEELRDHLLVCDLLRDMIEATFNKRDLFQRYYRPQLHRMATERARKSKETPEFDKDDPSFLVFPEIASETLANTVMQVAIEISLAGPEDLEQFRESKKDENGPAGRKLAKHRARDVYLSLYWNLWKRVYRQKYEHDSRGINCLAKMDGPSAEEANRQEFLDNVGLIHQSLGTAASAPQTLVHEALETFQERANELNHFIYEGREIDIGSNGDLELQKAVLEFCLRCGAIFKSGHKSKKLISLLEELSFDSNSKIVTLSRWTLEIAPN